MQCEICGEEIRGRSQRITLEGATLEVCNKCVQHGKTTKMWTPTPQKIAATGKAVYTRRTRRDVFDTLKEELVTGYVTLIKDAREKQTWTIEELASQINEKASLIRKIERGSIHPEDSVRKKLEHTLHIKLTEQIAKEDYKQTYTSKNTTLGDIAIIKRR